MGSPLRFIPNLIRGAWLNCRKTYWIFRRRKPRCPCRYPGAKADAKTADCEELIFWPNASALEHYCPHLKQVGKDWKCAAPVDEITTIWSAVGIRLIWCVVILWLVAGLSGWGIMRFRGYENVRPGWVMWPPLWSRIQHSQAELFRKKAEEAFAKGDIAYALLSLRTAEAADPTNYEVRSLVARLSAYSGDPGRGDHEFWRLLEEFPNKRPYTLAMWHDVLLATRRFYALADLSLMQARQDPERAILWYQSAWLASRVRRLSLDFPNDRDLDTSGIPEPWKQILELDGQAHGRSVVGLEDEALRISAADLGGVGTRLVMETLAGRIDPDRLWLTQTRLQEREAPMLRATWEYRAATDDAGRDQALRIMVAILLKRDQESDFWLACGLAVATSDRDVYAMLKAWMMQRGRPLTTPSLAALWLLARMNGDKVNAETLAQALAALAKTPPLASGPVDLTDFNRASPASIWNIISMVPLPREVTTSLLIRASDEVAQSGASRQP